MLRENTNNSLCSRLPGPGALIFPGKPRIPSSKVSSPHKCIGGRGGHCALISHKLEAILTGVLTVRSKKFPLVSDFIL